MSSRIIDLKLGGYMTEVEFRFHLRRCKHNDNHLLSLENMLEGDRRDADQHLLLRAINARADKDGKVYITVSGMDCDCVKYWGEIHTMDKPTLDEYYVVMDRIHESAEGPVYTSLIWPHEVEEIQREAGSRDLALEAFEDGHPHVVYY